MIYYFCIFIFFSIINVIVLGVGFDHSPFYAMQTILVPYNTEDARIVFSNLLLNYAVIMVFLMNIFKCFHELFSMNTYILSRTSKKASFVIYLKRTLKGVFILLLIKFVTDVLTGQIDGLLNIDIFLFYYISSILTLIIWTLFTFLLYILKIDENKIHFMLISSLFLIQYLSFSNEFLSVLVIATLNMLNQFWFWIVLKICVIIILLFQCYKLFLKCEFIGGMKDD